MKTRLIPFISAFLLPLTLASLHAKNAELEIAEKADKAEAPAIVATDFIRVDQDDQAARLQTGVTRYEKDGVVVDLLGAIHIADAAYFDKLNKEFTAYDALLFEMVGGENMKEGKMGEAGEKEKAKDPMLNMLGNVYGMVSGFLQLQGQKEGVDYSAKNFVHADLSLAEFEKLQEEKGESLIGFALQNASDKAGAAGGDSAQIDTAKMMKMLLSGDSNALKLSLVETLGEGDDQLSAFAGESVIIGDRNAKCLDILGREIKAGKKKLGIFYGAAHFPDMEQRMLKQGYKKTSHRWLTAWDIAKAKKN